MYAAVLATHQAMEVIITMATCAMARIRNDRRLLSRHRQPIDLAACRVAYADLANCAIGPNDPKQSVANVGFVDSNSSGDYFNYRITGLTRSGGIVLVPKKMLIGIVKQ
jgi:hypothetical protein